MVYPAAARHRMSQTFDIVIVGAGIVGAACAAECARAGFKVLVLERGPMAGGTTAAGMGHIVVMDDSEAQFALTSYSRDLWRRLRPALPDDVEYDECGTLWLAADEEEMGEVRRKSQYYTERGVRVEVLNAQDVRAAEPNLRPGMAGGLRVPEDGVLYPPCGARFLLEKAKQAGAEVRTGVKVTKLLPEGGVVLAEGSRIPAGRSVNAAGPWSPGLSPGLKVRKRKGHLVVTDRYPGFVHHQIVELGYLKSAHGSSKDSVAFNIQPRKTGQMLIGSSRQFDAEDSDVNQPILERMLNRALEYMPSLGRISATRVWTGHRAATPDKLPLIGPSPEHERVWFATGHEGLGITTSLGTGCLLADLLLERPTVIPAAPYAPSRFANTDGES
jgi:glycine/D-amino acid oxidase-like deaminating enzyme